MNHIQHFTTPIDPTLFVRKGLLLGLAATLVTLSSCGSEPDTKEPELQTESPGLISPFSSIEVRFSDQLNGLEDEQIASEHPVAMELVKGSVWDMTGADTNIGGYDMFVAGTAHDVSFKNIEDRDGNVQKTDQVLRFTTMPFLDKDFTPDGSSFLDNDDIAGAEFLSDSAKFYDGTSLNTGLSVTGIMLDRYYSAAEDIKDVFRIRARPGDSLFIKLTGFTYNLDLEFIGPESKAVPPVLNPDWVLSSNKNLVTDSIMIKIDANRHIHGTSNMVEYLNYWIRVAYPRSDMPEQSSPTPYVLEVRRIATAK